VTAPRGLAAARALLRLAWLVPLAALASCQALAGIEERELGPCGEYCDVVLRNCTGENAVYDSRETCLGTCRLLEPGESVEPQGQNTVACRLREARRAETAISEQVPEYCRAAGPEGIGCADSACEAYCGLYERTCSVQCNSHANCVDKCRALRDTEAFNALEDYEGDTLQCRFAHVANATLEPDAHCPHAKLVTPDAFCVDGAGADGEAREGIPSEPRCEDYCRVVGVACSGELAVYDDDATCLLACAALAPGTFADKSENSIGCRQYHAYNALCVPEPHCTHASPSGGASCGRGAEAGECASYCRLAAAFCSTEFAAAFPGGDAECLAACEGFAGRDDPSFSVARGDAGGNTLACRVLNATRAAADPSAAANTYCPAVFGSAPCVD
jgi:hypothetical protein